MSDDFKGRIALVTGASRGIGCAVAKALAAKGAHVIASARPRSQGALEELDDHITNAGGKCTILPLQLTDGEGIDRLGPAIYERFGRLDILVANAGILGPVTPLGHIETKDWNELINTNITANWRLIRTLDPILKLSKAGRAIFVTSGAVGKNRAYLGGYTMSKAAVEAIALTYAAECEITSVKVNVLDPGPVRTTMRAKLYPGEDASTLTIPEEVAALFIELASADCERSGEVIKYADWVKK
jgi:NAD(P)-dependent dehydrogenase (short-subunit alcohol dehydrogenase family)